MATYRTHIESPYSSSGNADSVSGTPDTRLSGFSPDDIRIARSSGAIKPLATPQNEGQHDPFVSNQNLDQKLSATALPFQPTLIPGRAAMPASSAANSSAPPLPGSAQFLCQQIAEDTPPPRAPDPIEILKFGVFTTDTGASRSIKVSGIYGSHVMPAVQASLDVS